MEDQGVTWDLVCSFIKLDRQSLNKWGNKKQYLMLVPGLNDSTCRPYAGIFCATWHCLQLWQLCLGQVDTELIGFLACKLFLRIEFFQL